VIVNYNGCVYLEACLRAVLDQELDGGFEVVLVDNASTDNSVEYVRSSWPSVRVVEAGANLGFAAGNNLGIDKACGRHLVLLNNDTRARPGWLKALVEVAESESGVGAVTSKLVFMDRPGVIQNAGSLVLSDGSGGDRGTGEEDRGQYDHREEVFAACGCAALLVRKMLDDVGVLDPTFFAYYEDTDLSWRMRLRGWRVLYEPGAVVEHVHSGTSIEWSPFFTFHVDRNRLFMILKNAPASFLVRALAHFAWVSARFAGRGLMTRCRSSKTQSAKRRSERAGASRARTHARVIVSLLRHLPEMLAKRGGIRRRRRVTDREILRWFLPRELWEAR
jgi:GT2 family glycosyltransferase